MKQYRSERSERWDGFEHRPGDIVISTRSKCGTTWMQMICLTLVHGDPLPAPLSLMSPWLDWDVEPREVVHARLAAQPHRRVIKTHTPLDGIPLHPEVRYVVVGRHPLDVAVSFFHHLGNIDRARSAELRKRPATTDGRPSLPEWMEAWVDDRRSPEEELDTLAGNVHHVTDAWNRQDAGNVKLVHFSELLGDRATVINEITSWLGIRVAADAWPAVVETTSFRAMRSDPIATVPDRLGVLKDPAAFFRSGSSGEGIELCSEDLLSRYHDRMADLTTPQIADWLHKT